MMVDADMATVQEAVDGGYAPASSDAGSVHMPLPYSTPCRCPYAMRARMTIVRERYEVELEKSSCGTALNT